MSVYSEARKKIKERPRICVNCGSTEDIEMHHIVPISEGGNNIESNIVMLCKGCHYRAHGARLGRYTGERKGRPKVEKPVNAEEIIERFIRGEVSGVEATYMLGLPRQHTFKGIWFVKEYFESKGIAEVVTNHGSKKKHDVMVLYKDGKREYFSNGKKIGVYPVG